MAAGGVDGTIATAAAAPRSSRIIPSVRCRWVVDSACTIRRRQPASTNRCGQDLRREDHQVGLERHGHPLTHRGDDVGAERQVGDELSVHHVPLDEVDAGVLERDDLVAEPGEVGGQDRRGDLDRSGHRSGNVPGRSIRAGDDLAPASRPVRRRWRRDRPRRLGSRGVRAWRRAGGDGRGRGADGEEGLGPRHHGRRHRPVTGARHASVRIATGRVRRVRVAAPHPRGPAGGPGRDRHRRAAADGRRRRTGRRTRRGRAGRRVPDHGTRRR